MIDCAGLILAGGRGRRLQGVDKGWARWRGRTLIEHVVLRLRPQVGALIISANRNQDRYRMLTTQVVADADPDAFAGPLSGICAGLHACPSEWLAVVPCDAPLLPLDLVARLLAAGRDREAAYVELDTGIEPLFCVLRASLGLRLQSSFAAGERSAQVWLRSIAAVAVPCADRSAFSNINTPADLSETAATS